MITKNHVYLKNIDSQTCYWIDEKGKRWKGYITNHVRFVGDDNDIIAILREDGEVITKHKSSVAIYK